ncbi:MAG: alpha/beta hydrolase [Burkholderiales bacterium]|nr:alpha/beta hydrolase [Burkholderiales bacterium]
MKTHLTSSSAGSRISLSDWAAGGRRISYRGHSIFVRSGGDLAAEPLLLIHGFPTASWDWEALWPALTERYRVYTFDLIGFGLSAKPRGYDYAIVDQANLCEAYLKGEGVHAYHVLAHDYGDSVAQELLARRHEPGARPKILSVALLNGGLFPEAHRPVLVQRLLLSPLGFLLSKFNSRATLAKSMRQIFGPETQPDDALIDDFWSLLNTNHGQAVMHKLIHYILERRQNRARWVGALQGRDVPIKLIDGTFDPISGGHMVARYKELVPQPDVTELDGIGHYPQVEAPNAVLKAYLAFRATQ